MRVFSKFVGLMALTALAGASAFAQMGRGGPPAFHGVWSPVVGHGAAYEMEGSDGKKSAMEVSVVAKESVDGKDAYWLEMSFESGERGSGMVMKHLMVLDGQQTRVVKMIMQMPGNA